MSTSRADLEALRGKSALVVGMGGLGCPAALALVRSGVRRLVLVDDDVVDAANLHRQFLYTDEDIGTDKLDAARRKLAREAQGQTQIELVRSRFLPENARELAQQVDVVLEGADNFATKFLAADACRLEQRPVVHGAAIRWRATVWCVAGAGGPCYRCLFEDLPDESAALTCDEAGVMGPVVGMAGALMADFALRVLTGDDPPFGRIHSYDGKTDLLRQTSVAPRASCPLCGAQRRITDIDESRYTAPGCAG